VIADLHEYAPRESEDDWRWRLTLQRFNTELCQRYLPQAAAVTTVSDSIAREYERVFGVQVSTITNAGPHRDPQPRPAHRPIRVAHTGVAAQNRRLEVMVEGFSGLANVELDLYLVAPASRSRFLDEMTALASGTSNVRVMEPVAMDRVPETLDAYDLGVHILAPTSFNNRYALPNKIFDFVQSGLGVIVGPSPEMARIVDRYAIGQVLEDFEAATLRRALAGLTAEAVSEWKESSCAASWDLSGESQAGSLVALALRLVG
jgi:hypothetical protein